MFAASLVVLSIFCSYGLAAPAYANDSEPFDRTGLAETPGNEWGSYFNVNQTKEDDAFYTVFGNLNENKHGGKSSCDSSQITFNRFYKSSEKPNERIYSYFCRKSEEYEHIKADFDRKQPLEFRTKLSAFGITDAGQYPQEFDIKGTVANELAKKIWEKTWNKFDTNIYCGDPSVEKTDEVEMKSENYLMYYRFLLYCNKGEDKMHTEFFVDEFYGKYMDGLPTICFLERPY